MQMWSWRNVVSGWLMEPLKVPPALKIPPQPRNSLPVSVAEETECICCRGGVDCFLARQSSEILLPASLWCCLECEGPTRTESDLLHPATVTAAALIISISVFFFISCMTCNYILETCWNCHNFQLKPSGPPTTSWAPARRSSSVRND